MKTRLIFFSLFLFTLNCSDPTPVGTGKPFSFLSSQPTGDEFYTAFSNTIDPSLFAANGEGSSAFLNQSGETTFKCDGGGSVKIKVSVSSTNLSGKSTFSSCKIVMTLNSVNYIESITGTANFGVISNFNGTSASATANSALTVSGVLGFSSDCDGSIANSSLLLNATTPVHCIFIDSEGKKLSSSVDDTLKTDIFIPYPPT